jgi:valyl-tRNA synthetase
MALIDALPKNFDPHAAAERFYTEWEEAGYFTPDPEAPGEPYVIVIPPPNVTGSLHMGHALNNTLQDILIRYKRMDGFNTLWVPGTDHAGIATQWMVERMLREKGLDRREMGREAFLKEVWRWKEESGGAITNQLRRLGVSCDWQRERFTMDDGLSKAVREVFVQYYEQGLIYRAERMVNWDPVGQTCLSNLEVVNEDDFQTEIWRFAYPLSEPTDALEEIVVATTRPETMLGDTAVAVHPDDPRYAGLIGKTVRHPILEREIPIVGDEILVDPEFGTGAVKVTPAHDFNDFEVGKRHGLPFLNILNGDGTINGEGGPFEGMDRFDAREAVKARLGEMGLDRGGEPHTMALPRSERSGTPVEPMISTQWFVRMEPLAKPAIEAVESGATRFVPQRWENTYFSWMREIRDWCISRQLWWGHQIPAWYCGACSEVTVGREDPTACQACGSTDLTQDEDVLDTWFSSALWPFSTLGWPEETGDLKRYYPTSVLVTGFDIIFFWVARMMFSGLHLMGEVPFAEVYINSIVRDAKGQKMSKTKGNGVDPLVAIDEVGADAFRFTLAAMAAQGRDVLWNAKRVEGYSRFQNKIWQAFRFAAMHLEDYDPNAERAPSPYDHWIQARAGEAVRRVRESLDGYRFNDAAGEIYAFTWDELCDWYLEFSKGPLYSQTASEAQKQAAKHTLWTMMHAMVRMMHPFMPFLSEEIWQHLPGTEGSIMEASYPKMDEFPVDPDALAEVARLQAVIVEVRRLRADMELSPRQALDLRTSDVGLLERNADALRDLAGIQGVGAGGRDGPCATFVVQGEEYYVPLQGVVDVDAERDRLTRVLERVQKDLDGLGKRLNNPSFTERAPAEVVEEVRGKHATATDKLCRLKQARESLG